MKATFQNGYGSPDVLELKEVETPTPGGGQVLVKVEGSAVNPLDWHYIRGKPIFARLSMGLTKPKDPRVGVDFAGTVVSGGTGMTEFKQGDEVYGVCMGAFSEYALAKVSRIALKPSNLSFEEAAAIPVAATTALQGLRDAGRIKSGQAVLVNGASGGVGSFAVQIAKSFVTDVTAVTSTRNVEAVRSIGADRVIDYTKEDFTRNGQRYDLIFDAVGNRSVSDCKRALNLGGNCVIAGYGGAARLFEHLVLGPLRSKLGGKKVGLMGTAKITRPDLDFLRELVEESKIKPLIDRRYPLAQVAEAVKYLETQHARGKVIVSVP